MLEGSTLTALQAYQKAADQAVGMEKGAGGVDILANNTRGSDGVFSRVFENTIRNTANEIGAGERLAKLSLTTDVPLDQLTAAVNQADLTLRTVVSLRDRFISAYQEVVRMQV